MKLEGGAPMKQTEALTPVNPYWYALICAVVTTLVITLEASKLLDEF